MKKYFIYTLLFIMVFPAISYGADLTGYHIDTHINLIPNDPKGNKKIILITIDDGPSKYGKDMVATLQKHNAKAIFFINGMHDKDFKGNIEFEHKAGFPIGNHTWSHLNLKKEKNAEKIKKEIDANTKLITTITGSAPKFFRPPYGAGTAAIRDRITKEGMIYMNWSGAAKDWEKNTKDEKVFIKNVLDGLHPGEILLIHEHEWTSKHLDTLLTTLEQKGYSFADPSQITR